MKRTQTKPQTRPQTRPPPKPPPINTSLRRRTSSTLKPTNPSPKDSQRFLKYLTESPLTTHPSLVDVRFDIWAKSLASESIGKYPVSRVKQLFMDRFKAGKRTVLNEEGITKAIDEQGSVRSMEVVPIRSGYIEVKGGVIPPESIYDQPNTNPNTSYTDVSGNLEFSHYADIMEGGGGYAVTRPGSIRSNPSGSMRSNPSNIPKETLIAAKSPKYGIVVVLGILASLGLSLSLVFALKKGAESESGATGAGSGSENDETSVSKSDIIVSVPLPQDIVITIRGTKTAPFSTGTGATGTGTGTDATGTGTGTKSPPSIAQVAQEIADSGLVDVQTSPTGEMTFVPSSSPTKPDTERAPITTDQAALILLTTTKTKTKTKMFNFNGLIMKILIGAFIAIVVIVAIFVLYKLYFKTKMVAPKPSLPKSTST